MTTIVSIFMICLTWLLTMAMLVRTLENYLKARLLPKIRFPGPPPPPGQRPPMRKPVPGSSISSIDDSPEGAGPSV